MKDKSCIIYILGAIIGFLAFTFSMIFVESASILAVVGMFGMWGMMYCLYKFFSKHSM